MKLRSVGIAAALLLSGCTAGNGSATDGAPSATVKVTTTAPVATQTDSPEPAVVAIPDVAGMAAFDAGRELNELGFDVSYAIGGELGDPSWTLTAANTDPAAGSTAPSGSRVRLEMIAEDPISHEIELDGQRAMIWISEPLTIQQAWILSAELASLPLVDGGYFIEINCIDGTTDSAFNRQANGKLAVGEKGGEALGLNPGVYVVELREGATCP